MAGAFDTISAGQPVLKSVLGGFFRGLGLLAGAWNGDREAVAIVAPAVTALFPTVLHLFLLASVLMTKWATPVVRPAVLLVLLRLSEAKTGVVTIVTGAIAAAVKVGQLAVKAFL